MKIAKLASVFAGMFLLSGVALAQGAGGGSGPGLGSGSTAGTGSSCSDEFPDECEGLDIFSNPSGSLYLTCFACKAEHDAVVAAETALIQAECELSACVMAIDPLDPPAEVCPTETAAVEEAMQDVNEAASALSICIANGGSGGILP